MDGQTIVVIVALLVMGGLVLVLAAVALSVQSFKTLAQTTEHLASLAATLAPPGQGLHPQPPQERTHEPTETHTAELSPGGAGSDPSSIERARRDLKDTLRN